MSKRIISVFLDSHFHAPFSHASFFKMPHFPMPHFWECPIFSWPIFQDAPFSHAPLFKMPHFLMPHFSKCPIFSCPIFQDVPFSYAPFVKNVPLFAPFLTMKNVAINKHLAEDPLIAPGILQTHKNCVFEGSAVENGSLSTIWEAKCCRDFYFLKQQQKVPNFCKNIFAILDPQKVIVLLNFSRKVLVDLFFGIILKIWSQFLVKM